MEPTEEIQLDFDSVDVQSTASANIVVGGRSIDFFFDPNNYPIEVDGHTITIEMRWGADSDTLIVKRIQNRKTRVGRNDRWMSPNKQTCEKASMSIGVLTRRQQSIALLYLIGRVLPDDD